MKRRIVRTSRQAEIAAEGWLRDLGFDEDFFVTGGGPDGAIDVRGRSVVAAVRNRKQKVSRPAVQTLKGAAAVAQKEAVYFSRSEYTNPAIEFSERAEVALYKFDGWGRLQPCNFVAADKMIDADARVARSHAPGGAFALPPAPALKALSAGA